MARPAALPPTVKIVENLCQTVENRGPQEVGPDPRWRRRKERQARAADRLALTGVGGARFARPYLLTHQPPTRREPRPYSRASEESSRVRRTVETLIFDAVPSVKSPPRDSNDGSDNESHSCTAVIALPVPSLENLISIRSSRRRSGASRRRLVPSC